MKKILLFSLFVLLSFCGCNNSLTEQVANANGDERNDNEVITELKKDMKFVKTYQSGDHLVDRYVECKFINSQNIKSAKIEFLGFDKHFYKIFDFKYLNTKSDGNNLVEIEVINHPIGSCLRYTYDNYETHICNAKKGKSGFQVVDATDEDIWTKRYYYDKNGDLAYIITITFCERTYNNQTKDTANVMSFLLQTVEETAEFGEQYWEEYTFRENEKNNSLLVNNKIYDFTFTDETEFLSLNEAVEYKVQDLNKRYKSKELRRWYLGE